MMPYTRNQQATGRTCICTNDICTQCSSKHNKQSRTGPYEQHTKPTALRLANWILAIMLTAMLAHPALPISMRGNLLTFILHAWRHTAVVMGPFMMQANFHAKRTAIAASNLCIRATSSLSSLCPLTRCTCSIPSSAAPSPNQAKGLVPVKTGTHCNIGTPSLTSHLCSDCAAEVQI
jgi:hypothetical protein